MKLLFAGGGTAGHVNPALAVAKEIRREDETADIRFVGTPGKIESRLVPREGFPFISMEMHGLSRSLTPKGIAANITAVREALAALREMKKLLREFRPDAVIGAGGYASFPAVRAAEKMGIPTALIEVNALPGVVTKMLSKKADAVMLSFEAAQKHLPENAPCVLTGSPVRPELLAADREKARAELGVGDRPLVVSFWGSLGAAHMNEKMVDFIRMEQEEKRFVHIHAAGSSGFSRLSEALSQAGINYQNNPLIDLREYIYDMDRVMAAADLVICRAGASTLAELCAVGRASLLVPSPYVAENHQEVNARALEERGAAVVALESECTGASLYEQTRMLLQSPGRLRAMEQAAREMGVVDAADRICRTIREITA